MSNQINPNLSPFEKQVLFDKATEAPFSGEYDKHFEDGIYTCKNCGNLLYYSRDKFNSGCGWPAFDDEAVDSVAKIADKDGRRIEIICNYCQSHLGHVFAGEKLTQKNSELVALNLDKTRQIDILIGLLFLICLAQI